ncbi:hypothetical protein I3842_02G032800 [Carya illinoinensis]|uniref:ARID domain-containing protein n=2 Tax=Carya illinoinensis TaxID=32201 RepID=A0A922FRU6_CARIL|nr:hypothetical protein I3842_02G032800 [Carya illinoinensis]
MTQMDDLFPFSFVFVVHRLKVLRLSRWSMLADDGSAVDCDKSPSKKLKPSFCVDLEPDWKVSNKFSEACAESERELDKLRCDFEGFLRGFGKEICTQNTFRPLPLMLGDGQHVDLLKLFLVVREKGGWNAVSENGLWHLVAKESGLFGSNLASPVKLVNIKFLDTLERWSKRAVENKGLDCGLNNGRVSFSGYLMEAHADLRPSLTKAPGEKQEYPHLELLSEEVESNGGEKCDGVEGLSGLNLVGKFGDSKKLCNEGEREAILLDGDENDVVIEEKQVCLDSSESVANVQDGRNLCDNEVNSLVAEQDGGKRCDIDDDDVVILDPGRFCVKRKRESLCGMLSWITGVAKNPCDRAVGSLPECSKWKSHGKEEMWKQVLLAREAIFLKRQVDSSADQWQKAQKMHPCLYDDQLGSTYNFRERLRHGKKLNSEKTTFQAQACSESLSATQSGSDKSPCAEVMKDGVDNELLGNTDLFTENSALDKYVPKGISWKPRSKAEVQEWTGMTSESDTKWLGTRVWPLEKVEQRYLIERDPIGKGRQNSCGCEVPGSIECIRFHSGEKKLRVKRELGSAFYQWKFDEMGEEVKLSWTKEEEQKFKATLKSNPASLQTFFRDQKFFPTKSREDLVSYYFNVFLMERRGYQNRFTPNSIDSDDEELESVLVTNGTGQEAEKSPSSIFYSPKKPHTNLR